MKKTVVVLSVLLLALGVAVLAAAAGGKKLDVKVGDSYYVCNCGDACPCDTISGKEGKCSCDKPLVKAKVTKAEGDKAFFKADGWDKEREFALVGKYACACGPECKCDTISQNPGKCPCGAELKKVE